MKKIACLMLAFSLIVTMPMRSVEPSCLVPEEENKVTLIIGNIFLLGIVCASLSFSKLLSSPGKSQLIKQLEKIFTPWNEKAVDENLQEA